MVETCWSPGELEPRRHEPKSESHQSSAGSTRLDLRCSFQSKLGGGEVSKQPGKLDIWDVVQPELGRRKFALQSAETHIW